MTVVCQVSGLALSGEPQLNSYLLFYMNKGFKICYSARKSKKKSP